MAFADNSDAPNEPKRTIRFIARQSCIQNMRTVECPCLQSACQIDVCASKLTSHARNIASTALTKSALD